MYNHYQHHLVQVGSGWINLDQVQVSWVRIWSSVASQFLSADQHVASETNAAITTEVLR